MRILATLALATLFACSADPCQELGEKLCGCTGKSSDSCKAQVEDDLKRHEMDDATCERYLESCDAGNAPEGTDFCEWLFTEEGKTACGITSAPP